MSLTDREEGWQFAEIKQNYLLEGAASHIIQSCRRLRLLMMSEGTSTEGKTFYNPIQNTPYLNIYIG